ncbi:DUF4132 domain-containing protein [Fusobacterium polymorphum]|uniref:DUF4132 domain-containing protein n=1 Tax=Fusobacterium nucleatum subsp. polymorphum TaxID=76857 RepID=A0A2C6BNX7_FUSNP|nr:DUF4132 domain-containing protein [Fusobacterium polymorphum]PHI06287.1 hypothetical protein CBG54_04245 [Fusobacterium polymorphum]PHI15571.1 hypothetical protein CBG58_00165 [Fusobacterium polymorphum]
MLNFYGNKFTSKVNSFISKIKTEVKTLDRDNQRFIEDIFTKKNYHGYGEILQDNLINKFSRRENAKFEDIFPENIYPALEILIGEANLKNFIKIGEKITKTPYTMGYTRRMVRSTNYRNYIDKLFSVLKTFVHYKFFDIDTKKLLLGNCDFHGLEGWDLKNLISSLENKYVIANEIDNGNQEVIDFINEALTSGSSKNIGYGTLTAIFVSENKSLVEMAGKLLLAAQRQEGLRQQICETIDEGSQENFEYMFKIIYNNDLIRFSSVKRALGVWTGLLGQNYNTPETVGKKELEIINKLIDNPKYANELLKSDDNIEVYLALWYKASQDVKFALEAVQELLKVTKTHTKLLVAYNLDIFQDIKYQRTVAKDIIKEYSEKDDNDFLKIVACYWEHLSYNAYTNTSIKTNRGLFDTTDEAKEFFEILKKVFVLIDGKDKGFNPIIFPWVSRYIYKHNIASLLFTIATSYPELNLKNEVFTYFKAIEPYSRGAYLKSLFNKPENEDEELLVVKMLADASVTNEANKIIRANNLASKYAKEIEDALRLKTADVRKNAISLILSLESSKLLETTENLVKDKNGNKRLAGLDILTKVKDKPDFAKEKIEKILASIKEPTDPEKILIDGLVGKVETTESSDLYDKTYKFELPYEVKEVKKLSKNVKKNKDGVYILEKSIDAKDIFTKTEDELFELVKKFNALIVNNGTHEYTNAYTGEKTLLRNDFLPIVKRTNYYYSVDEHLDEYPLADTWREFYKNEIKDFSTLYQLYLLTQSHLRIENFNNVINKILHTTPRIILNKIIQHFKTFSNNEIMEKIVYLLYKEYKEENKEYLFETSKVFFIELLKENPANLVHKRDKNENYNSIFDLEYSIPTIVFRTLSEYYNEKTFTENLILKLNFENKMATYKLRENFYSLLEIANAVELGLVEKDLLIKSIFSKNIDDMSTNFSNLYNFLGIKHPNRYYYYNNEEVEKIKNSWNYDNAVKVLKKYGLEVINYVVDNELKRGDSKTKYSKLINSINRIEGVDYLIKILQALGNEKLVRNEYWYGDNTSKKEVLSHLLKVCFPGEKDDLKTFNDKIKKTNVSEERLVEVAMYSSQWIELIDKFLKWKGFTSGCYYFQAHMSDVSKDKEGIIAKYSPISIEDFQAGAFDIDWFKDAYKQLGKEHFDILYESAKYITDGAKHSRARKFADAVLGNMKVKDVEKEISAKRNKDLVASYSLIPLAKNKIKDALSRYKFLQNFLKESKQFGAQRRASEAKAFEVSLENLSRNMGYSDVTRLTWAMESEMMAEMKKFFEPKKIQDYSVYIEIDELGQSSIKYEKDGKVLKSLPTKIKTEKYIEEIKEVHKNLKEQYSRSRKMLEQSMEDGVEFYVYEIKTLSANPVIAPLIKDLVFKVDDILGYYEDNKLIGFDKKSKKLTLIEDIDKDALLTIAHPFDLFNSKQWPLYQQDILGREVKQVFKQVFRELYVKTKDELKMDKSKRYAGHQIQPTKSIALLKTRRWVVDDYEGLQKVYYKENIIAKMYAMTDWYSPAEVEAPTIEDIVFYDRKTFELMTIEDVPDLVFSEVMRDIDLVVSVAHVGDVDPEASQSTIEMRKAIIEFNAKLFKLKNVTFTESHALIKGTRAEYSIHLGSGVIHQKAGATIEVLPVHSQHRGRIFLPFIDEDPKTAEIMSKVLLFAQDEKIKDIFILEQIIKI